MTAITGSDTYFTNIDGSFTATKWEACIDQAIDLINGELKEAALSNMTGVAGAKTVTVTSPQAGWVRGVATAIYATMKTAGASSSSFSVAGISESSSTSAGGGIGDPYGLAKEAAKALQNAGFRRT